MERIMDCIKTILIVGVNSTIGSAILNIYSEKKYICFGTYNKEPLSNEIRNKCKNVIQCDLSSHEGIQKLLKFCQELKPYHIVYLPGYIDAKSLEPNFTSINDSSELSNNPNTAKNIASLETEVIKDTFSILFSIANLQAFILGTSI